MDTCECLKCIKYKENMFVCFFDWLLYQIVHWCMYKWLVPFCSLSANQLFVIEGVWARLMSFVREDFGKLIDGENSIDKLTDPRLHSTG